MPSLFRGCYFYPRSPCGERRKIKDFVYLYNFHFYPRSPCGERRSPPDFCYLDNIISIHALLAESDVMDALELANTMLFLSTLSLRRATVDEVSGDTWARDFYPRSPCGERRANSQRGRQEQRISIHALLAESDLSGSTKPKARRISIHALLAESDIIKIRFFFRPPRNFYPRSPCGERLLGRGEVV